MEFALPATLAEELLQYDANFRAQLETQRREEEQRQQHLGAKRAAQKRIKGNSRPLGMPIGIIPPETVPAETLERALTIINGAAAKHRHEHWLTPEGHFLAAVWHLNAGSGSGSFWMAAWADAERTGVHLRIMGKDSCAPRRPWSCHRFRIEYDDHGGIRYSTQSDPLFPNTDAEKTSGLWTQVKLPRTTWWSRSWFFSPDSVASDPDFLMPEKLIDITEHWGSRLACGTYQFRYNTSLRVLRYCSTLIAGREAVLQNHQLSSIFAACQQTPYLLLRGLDLLPQLNADNFADIVANWKPSIGDIPLAERDNTPYFRSHFTRLINDWLEHYAKARWDLDTLIDKWRLIVYEAQDLQAIHTLWPDITRDHVQALFLNSIAGTQLSERYHLSPRHQCFHRNLTQDHLLVNWRVFLSQDGEIPRAARWIRDNVPIETWIRWCHTSNRDDLARALTALMRLTSLPRIDDDYVIPRPERWRLEETANLFEQEIFLRTTPKEALPQDLFPTPVKVLSGGTKYSFFQPLDTHQLHAWGSAVRNCVGNGSYANRVKQHQAFIVLAQVDNKPIFTVQLSLRDGTLIVDQLVGVANQRPDQEIQAAYAEAFRQALEMRASSLTPSAA